MTVPIWEKTKVTLSKNFFSTFAGITFKPWMRILRENRYAVDLRFWPRAFLTTVGSISNSLATRLEARKFAEDCANAKPVADPVFILGHWRSGTTHLHNLMSMDPRLSVPNFYQVTFPNGFLLSEKTNKPLYDILMPKERQIDRMQHGFDQPAEDEFAIAQLAGTSSYWSWTFPRHMDRYDQYLTLRNVSEEERQDWKEALDLFVRKLTVKYDRRLVLKSPPHTCRIKLILDLYPNAKFVHIHRHPFDVFHSTKRMTEVIIAFAQLQHFDASVLDDRVINQYREMYDVYLEERSLIPQGHLFEIGYDELKSNPLDSIRTMYEKLELPDFAETEPVLRDYLSSVADYKPSKYKPIEPALREKIVSQWQPMFDAFGYDSTQ